MTAEGLAKGIDYRCIIQQDQHHQTRQESCSQEYFGLLWCVDPDQHCALMLIYDTHIVVLLFRQEGALEEHEQEGTFTERYDICA